MSLGLKEVKNTLEATAIFSLAVSSITIVYLVFHYCGYGFDFTDESFYLHWISHPELYSESVTQFGFIYHPLYQLLNGDLILLRKFNVLIILILSFLNSYFILNDSFFLSSNSNRLKCLLLSLPLSVSVLSYFQLWITTPSYNSLNLQSLLLVSLGLMLISRRKGIYYFVPSFLVGIGLWLSFMAKITSFAALSLLCLVYLIFVVNRKLRVFLVAASIFSSLVIISAISIDGSILKFKDRFVMALESSSVLGSQHSVGNIFMLGEIELSITQWGHVSYFLFSMIAILFFASKNVLKKENLAPVAFMSLLPFVFSFGTNNNFWQFSTMASFFWVASFFIILSIGFFRKSFTSFFFLAMIVQHGFVYFGLNKSWREPYRQYASFKDEMVTVSLGEANTLIRVSPDIKKYIETLRLSTLSEKPDAIVDLTGHFPGASYVIGAISPGKPWLMGGYPGSANYASGAIRGMNCEVFSRAWLLVELNSRASIASLVFRANGLELNQDYKQVADIISPFKYTDMSETQLLFKPLDPKKNSMICKKNLFTGE